MNIISQLMIFHYNIEEIQFQALASYSYFIPRYYIYVFILCFSFYESMSNLKIV